MSIAKVKIKMAGRGRGRGRGGLSFNTEALQIQRGEIISNPGLTPSPLFPTLVHKPIPLLDETPSQKSLIELKQEFLARFQQSPFYMTADEKRQDIERYSDKYQPNHPDQEQTEKWTPDWSLFPSELKPKKRKAPGSARPNLKKAKRTGTGEDVLSKLDNLEKAAGTAENAGNEDDGEEEEKEEGEGEVEEDEDFDDEEEETDYNLNYFDNGEDYGGEDDDDEAEAVYS